VALRDDCERLDCAELAIADALLAGDRSLAVARAGGLATLGDALTPTARRSWWATAAARSRSPRTAWPRAIASSCGWSCARPGVAGSPSFGRRSASRAPDEHVGPVLRRRRVEAAWGTSAPRRGCAITSHAPTAGAATPASPRTRPRAQAPRAIAAHVRKTDHGRSSRATRVPASAPCVDAVRAPRPRKPSVATQSIRGGVIRFSTRNRGRTVGA
jgi:hypothetical protein